MPSNVATGSLAFAIPFSEEREAYLAEHREHYSGYPVDIAALEKELAQWVERHPDASPCAVKAKIYELAAERCPVKIFRHDPFYHELITGRKQNDWGFNGLGGWLYRRNYHEATRHLHERVGQWGRDDVCSSNLFDIDHHCAGYDKMLRLGLRGIMAEAERRLDATDDEERHFLQALIRGQRACIRIAERMGEEAARLAQREQDLRIKARLELIAHTAPRAPANPPKTFYEALAALLFYREMTTSLEGLGVSVLGHLDRLLGPYYEKDVAEGRLTYEQARDLMGRYLNYTDARWDPGDRGETSTTVIIGGCDAQGNVVANDVTRMIVESFLELPLCNPKLNARMSDGHPDWYLDLLGELVLSGKNVLAVFNDEVLIPSGTAYGRALADARLYVAGGCQEPVLANTEFNDRAWGGVWRGNMPKLLLVTMGGVTGVRVVAEQDRILDRAGVRLTPGDGADFEAFYAAFVRLVRAVWGDVMRHVAAGQALAAEINPCPFFSGGIEDCIQKGEDMMAGGARYNATTVCYIGLGTLVDSLWAIRRTVYEDRRVTLAELAQQVADNFVEAEELAAYLRSLPKFGHGDPAVDRLAQRVSRNFIQAVENLPHGRGGRAVPGYFAYGAFADCGRAAGATPDGRHAGEPYSQGTGPSRLRYPKSPTDPIRSQAALRLERIPGCGVLDVFMPLSMTADTEPHWINWLIRGFVANHGSVLQFGVMDPKMLRDAQKHPESYPDLQVRVCGFTATFVTLDRATQDEMIGRMQG